MFTAIYKLNLLWGKTNQKVPLDGKARVRGLEEDDRVRERIGERTVASVKSVTATLAKKKVKIENYFKLKKHTKNKIAGFYFAAKRLMESPKSTDKGQYFLIYLFPKNIISHHHRKSGQDSYASRMDAVQYYHKKVAITQSIEPCPSSVDDHISTGIAGQWQRNKFS